LLPVTVPAVLVMVKVLEKSFGTCTARRPGWPSARRARRRSSTSACAHGRGTQIALVATARKLGVPFWHLLTQEGRARCL